MSESDPPKFRVKPLFLITPGAMTPEDIARVEKECEIVIAECKEPNMVRLLEPPIDAGMDKQARAALALARLIVNHDGPMHQSWPKSDLIQFFIRALIDNPQPPPVTKAKR